jgi:hypothetical protein
MVNIIGCQILKNRKHVTLFLLPAGLWLLSGKNSLKFMALIDCISRLIAKIWIYVSEVGERGGGASWNLGVLFCIESTGLGKVQLATKLSG